MTHSAYLIASSCSMILSMSKVQSLNSMYGSCRAMLAHSGGDSSWTVAAQSVDVERSDAPAVDSSIFVALTQQLRKKDVATMSHDAILSFRKLARASPLCKRGTTPTALASQFTRIACMLPWKAEKPIPKNVPRKAVCRGVCPSCCTFTGALAMKASLLSAFEQLARTGQKQKPMNIVASDVFIACEVMYASAPEKCSCPTSTSQVRLPRGN